MTRVNLIPRLRRQQTRRRLHQRRWITACAGYVLFITVAFVMSSIIFATDEGAIAQDIEHTSGLIQGDHDAAAVLRRKLEDAASLLKAQYAVEGQPDWAVLLALVAEATGEDIMLRQCRLEPAGHGGLEFDRANAGATRRVEGVPPTVLEIAGLGRTQNTVTQFVLRMDQIPLFRKVKLQDTRREPFGEEEAVAFRIVCHLDAEGSQP